MKNIRIWAETEKRCEALWLEQLLTICGYQAWKETISIHTTFHCPDARFHYVDVFLLGGNPLDDYWQFAKRNRFQGMVVSGPITKVNLLKNNFNVLGACGILETDDSESLEELMSVLSVLISRNFLERSTLLRMTRLFAEKENFLSRAMYTITEMFCSRRINYLQYENHDILISAVKDVEKWIRSYIVNTELDLTYQELFAITYLKNLINEGYIKARISGGYDVTELFQNANYLLHEEPQADAVLYLKLLILHNSINYLERPEDILKMICEVSAPEYIGKAVGEVIDIYREVPERTSRFDIRTYYKLINERDVENYRTIYRSGLVLEAMGIADSNFYMEADKKYERVILMLESIELVDRTPQEYEYLYKAICGDIRTRILFDKYRGNFTRERKQIYFKRLNKLIADCMNFQLLKFWNKIYGASKKRQDIIKLMSEKMQKVQNLASNLIKTDCI